MPCRVLIPIKAPAACKTRLAGVMRPSQRAALVAGMLARVADAAQAARRVDQVAILGPCRHGLSRALLRIDDGCLGLSEAATFGLARSHADGFDRVVLISADLPHIAPADVEALCAVGPDEMAIAPDVAGTGTNAISLPLPAARRFLFQFGPYSFMHHSAAAAALGLRRIVIQRAGLARDVDVPGDLTGLTPFASAGPVIRRAASRDAVPAWASSTRSAAFDEQRC